MNEQVEQSPRHQSNARNSQIFKWLGQLGYVERQKAISSIFPPRVLFRAHIFHLLHSTMNEPTALVVYCGGR